MERKLTGIERAVVIAGGQSRLANLISKLVPGSRVKQPHVRYWLVKGHVSARSAQTVSFITGVPVADLLKQKPEPKPKKAQRRGG
jgi:hypothetical protein